MVKDNVVPPKTRSMEFPQRIINLMLKFDRDYQIKDEIKRQVANSRSKTSIVKGIILLVN